MVKGRKPIPSRNLTVEEVEAANGVKSIVVWPCGIRKPPVIYPLGATDEETAAIVKKLNPIESKEDR